MISAKRLLVSCSLFLVSFIAKAGDPVDGKSEPAIQGYVADGYTKKPVKGVVISVKSVKGDKEYVTDANGTFKVGQLPTGEVTIVLEKKGYKTYRREGVLLKEGMNLRLNFDMFLEDVADESDIFHPLERMMDGD